MARDIYIKILRTTSTKMQDYVNFPLGVGELGWATDNLELYIGTGTTNRPIGKLTLTEHNAFPTLVHDLAQVFYEEVNYDITEEVTGVTYWTNSGKTQKIRQVVLNYTGEILTSCVTTQYNTSGNLVMTFTETLSWSGDKLLSVTAGVA